MLPMLASAQLRLFKFKDKRYCKMVYRYYNNIPLNLDSTRAPYLYFNIYNWIGTKYQYGGDDLNGVDCSGFVKAIYAQVYCVSIARNSSEICV